MASDSITLYKLIILYTLEKAGQDLPLPMVSDYITGQGYTNYFTVQNAFGELLQAGMIQENSTYHTTYYSITETGKETLSLFGQPLSPEIRKEIEDYLTERKIEIINETSLVCDYTSNSRGYYIATCNLMEGNNIIFQTKLEVASEAEAIQVCEKWQEKSQDIYQFVLTNLL